MDLWRLYQYLKHLLFFQFDILNNLLNQQDVIILLESPEKDKDNGNRKLIIAKNKDGGCGAVDLKLNGETQRFMEMVNYG